MEVYLTSNSGQKFVANIDPHVKIRTNDPVIMHVDIDRVHVFEQGENIGLQ